MTSTKGKRAFVTVRAKQPVDKERVEAIVRGSFRFPVERVDLVI